jgi:hypothetical protein
VFAASIKIASLVIVTKTEFVAHATTERKTVLRLTLIVAQQVFAADARMVRLVLTTMTVSLLCVVPTTNVKVAATKSQILTSRM